MCGIYGAVMRPGEEPRPSLLHAMGERLAHRGPDGDGMVIRGRVGLGCRRLAVIDVCVGGSRSGFAGIAKLVPGTRLVVEGEGMRVEPFWDLLPGLAAPPVVDDFEPAAAVLRCELERAVDAALVSDVPVGVFLSGGLDSTAIAAIARRRLGAELNTFTVAFDAPGFDERDH